MFFSLVHSKMLQQLQGFIIDLLETIYYIEIWV